MRRRCEYNRSDWRAGASLGRLPRAHRPSPPDGSFMSGSDHVTVARADGFGSAEVESRGDGESDTASG